MDRDTLITGKTGCGKPTCLWIPDINVDPVIIDVKEEPSPERKPDERPPRQ